MTTPGPELEQGCIIDQLLSDSDIGPELVRAKLSRTMADLDNERQVAYSCLSSSQALHYSCLENRRVTYCNQNLKCCSAKEILWSSRLVVRYGTELLKKR